MIFPWNWKPGVFLASHLTMWHGACYSNLCPHYAVGKGLLLSLTQTAVALEKQIPVIPGVILAAERWWADWQPFAWSLSWASRCVPLWGEGKKAHGVCVCTFHHPEFLLWWVWLSVKKIFWSLTLRCYFKAFSQFAQRKSRQVKHSGTRHSPFRGTLYGESFFRPGWPSNRTLDFQAWLKAQPLWGKALLCKTRSLKYKGKILAL